MKNLPFISFILLLFACSKPDKPVYTDYKNIRLQKTGLRSTVIAAELGLYNPNNYELQVKDAAINVALNNHAFGRLSLNSLVRLASKDTTYIPLQLQASTKDILLGSARIWLNSNVKVKLDGSIKAGRGGLFVTVPVNYEGTQQINLNGLDTANLSTLQKRISSVTGLTANQP